MIYFVTGTDTGVGKTHVTALLVRALRRDGFPARGIKPIETGWPDGDEATTETDAAKLAAASEQETNASVLLRFAAPRSPRAAAAAEGRSIDIEAVVTWCHAQSGTPLFVEGAGGWMVPIGETSRMRDLAGALEATVVVVARAGLGTINHAILTVESVQRTAPLFGVILSRRDEDDLSFARENADEIAGQTGARVAILPDDHAVIEAWFRPAER